MAPAIMTTGFPGAVPRWDSKQILQRMNSLGHMDAAENMFFLRELEFISKRLYDVKYAVLKGRQFVPTDNEGVAPGHMSYTYRMWDFHGNAKPIADMSDDLPLVNLNGAEATQRLQPYGVAYSYSIEEIQAASLLNRPLEADRAIVAKKVLDQQLDKIAAVGDSDRGLKGFLNLSNTETYTPITKAAGGTSWVDSNGNLVATPDEVLRDLNGIKRQMVVDTKEVESPTRYLLPTAQYQVIANTPRSSVSDTTILEFFKGNNPEIEVFSWERLTGAGTNGADLMVAYDPSVEKVKLLMALEFTQLPPQPKNFSWLINCWCKCGGVVSPYPKSISYASGV